MNIFSERLYGTGLKAHIRVETVIPFNKIGAFPQVFAYLVYPNGRELLVDEGGPIDRLAEAIATRQRVTIPHVGYDITVVTNGSKVEIGWGQKGEKAILGYAYDAEALLQQIGPHLVNKYLGLS